MTDADLEIVIARTGHGRFRWLTSEENPDAVRREGYRDMVARMAAGKPPEPEPKPARRLLPLDESRRVLRVGHRNCFYATNCGCAGGGAHCHHLGRVVSLVDCAGCLGPRGDAAARPSSPLGEW